MVFFRSEVCERSLSLWISCPICRQRSRVELRRIEKLWFAVSSGGGWSFRGEELNCTACSPLLTRSVNEPFADRSIDEIESIVPSESETLIINVKGIERTREFWKLIRTQKRVASTISIQEAILQRGETCFSKKPSGRICVFLC